jgi:hypothetical protein
MIKDMLCRVPLKIVKGLCYYIDVPCCNFYIFRPVKMAVKKPHLGSACDWLRQQFIRSLETRYPEFVIQWKEVPPVSGTVLRIPTLGCLIFNVVSHALYTHLWLRELSEHQVLHEINSNYNQNSYLTIMVEHLPISLDAASLVPPNTRITHWPITLFSMTKKVTWIYQSSVADL